MSHPSERIFKALADSSRLAIYKVLLERPAYVEILSERLRLAPSTVSFHLKKLHEAGLLRLRKDQYYSVYEAEPKYKELTLADLVEKFEIDETKQNRAEEVYEAKVYKSFFKYGKLLKIPVQNKKKSIVLKKISESLDLAKSYTEPQISALLSEIFEDVSTLRRELVGAGLVTRTNGVYRRV